MASREQPHEAPTHGGIKHKLIRGGIAVAVLIAIGIGVISLLPGLSGMRSAITGDSPWWVLAAAAIQLVGIVGAVAFVQVVFADEPHPLTWKMGGGSKRRTR
jgi:hypothetical protein